MERIYIGVDFHARQQTICYLTTETGELVTCELKHQDKEAVRAFYAAFRGQVIVRLEASGYSPWFERLLEGRVPILTIGVDKMRAVTIITPFSG